MRFLHSKLTWSLAALALATGTLHAQEAAIDVQVDTDSAAAASQATINQLDDAATEALQAYRVAIQRAESLEIYNRQIQRLIESQEAEISSIQRQTAEIENIETGALPFMIEMTETLSEVVESDVPFLRDERLKRIDDLKLLIDRADVTAGEKYRRIMEAYMVEAEYGRTIEAYSGNLAVGGTVRSVDFLRIGRIGLYYQTLDGDETGRWSPVTGEWEILEGDYRTSVRDGLRIARQQAPPNLLKLPINAPEAG